MPTINFISRFSIPRWLSFCVLTAMFFAPIQAKSEEQMTGLAVDLVSETSHIQPGKAFYVGLWVQPEPGYHTYWKQPGIVGVPTSIEWKLPEGWSAGELEYPEPESVLMFTIDAQGFKRNVMLLAKITPPADLAVGETIAITGRATWMCCAKTCHPGFKDVTLSLPVETSAPSFDERWHPLFEKERAAVAKTSDAWSATARQLNREQVEVTLTPATANARELNPAIASQIKFFTGDGWIDSDDPHQVEYDATTGGLKLLLPVSKGLRDKPVPEQLYGLLQLNGGWQTDGSPRTIEIHPVLKH